MLRIRFSDDKEIQFDLLKFRKVKSTLVKSKDITLDINTEIIVLNTIEPMNI